MHPLAELYHGLLAYFRAWTALRRASKLHWLLLPALFNLLLFIAIGVLAWFTAARLIEGISAFLGWDTGYEKWKELRWVLSFGLRLLAISLYLRLYKYIMLILLAPFLAFYSDKIRFLFTGKISAGGSLAKQTMRGAALGGLFLLLDAWLWFLAIVLGVVLPPALPLMPLLLAMGSALFFGLALLDYGLEYRGIPLGESLALLFSRHKARGIGIGLGYQVLLLLPLFGLLVGPMWSLAASCVEEGGNFEERKNICVEN